MRENPWTLRENRWPNKGYVLDEDSENDDDE